VPVKSVRHNGEQRLHIIVHKRAFMIIKIMNALYDTIRLYL